MIEKDWTTESGYRAVAYRHDSLGHLCGYVGVPTDHPLHGSDYDHPDMPDIEVHGGITYADSKAPSIDGDGRWWFGFDCAHLGDYIPGLPSVNRANNGVERSLEYVVGQCESMAGQLFLVWYESAPSA